MARGYPPGGACAGAWRAGVDGKRSDQAGEQAAGASADERALLADSMGFAALRDFDVELTRHRAQVSEQFAQIFGDSDPAGATRNDAFTAVWEEPEATITSREQLSRHCARM